MDLNPVPAEPYDTISISVSLLERAVSRQFRNQKENLSFNPIIHSISCLLSHNRQIYTNVTANLFIIIVLIKLTNFEEPLANTNGCHQTHWAKESKIVP